MEGGQEGALLQWGHLEHDGNFCGPSSRCTDLFRETRSCSCNWYSGSGVQETGQTSAQDVVALRTPLPRNAADIQSTRAGCCQLLSNEQLRRAKHSCTARALLAFKGADEPAHAHAHAQPRQTAHHGPCMEALAPIAGAADARSPESVASRSTLQHAAQGQAAAALDLSLVPPVGGGTADTFSRMAGAGIPAACAAGKAHAAQQQEHPHVLYAAPAGDTPSPSTCDMISDLDSFPDLSLDLVDDLHCWPEGDDDDGAEADMAALFRTFPCAQVLLASHASGTGLQCAAQHTAPGVHAFACVPPVGAAPASNPQPGQLLDTWTPDSGACTPSMPPCREAAAAVAGPGWGSLCVAPVAAAAGRPSPLPLPSPPCLTTPPVWPGSQLPQVAAHPALCASQPSDPRLQQQQQRSASVLRPLLGRRSVGSAEQGGRTQHQPEEGRVKRHHSMPALGAPPAPRGIDVHSRSGKLRSKTRLHPAHPPALPSAPAAAAAPNNRAAGGAGGSSSGTRQQMLLFLAGQVAQMQAMQAQREAQTQAQLQQLQQLSGTIASYLGVKQ
mmetsp:Transcript_7886/g.19706  ORF Transcript_7886/g.19706 Transcript_7886/m.19706 type:complete len:555 (-) Transcript_7886:600-2264(-)